MDDQKTFFNLMKTCSEDFTYISSVNGYYEVSAAGTECQNLDGRTHLHSNGFLNFT